MKMFEKILSQQSHEAPLICHCSIYQGFYCVPVLSSPHGLLPLPGLISRSQGDNTMVEKSHDRDGLSLSLSHFRIYGPSLSPRVAD